MRQLLTWFLLVLVTTVWAAPDADSTDVEQPVRKMSWLRRTIQNFSKIDTCYVEPQHYNWSVMLQATHTYDYYRLSTTGQNSQSFTFSPEPNFKLGPYFGWRWIFLGYTFDLKNIDVSNSSLKQEIVFSLYSSRVGVDVFFRRTGRDYHVRQVSLGDNIDAHGIEGLPFGGINVGITGVNLYYIFNHKRFSYPAAFNQSTRQKISCGSWMAGIGYMHNYIDLDYDKLETLITDNIGPNVPLSEGLKFNSVEYTDFNASVGYAYNWVFARNFLFCSSLSLALAYKRTLGDNNERRRIDLKNINLDGIGRFGLVYNNDRWYAGTSAIVRAYNYKMSTFAANNIFGSLNIYVGYNFGARSAYKKKSR